MMNYSTMIIFSTMHVCISLILASIVQADHVDVDLISGL